jgi:hypothetical protein
MQDRSTVYRWVPVAFGVFLAAIVGFWAYNLGLAHGLAQQLPPPPAGVYPWAYYRPWGFGPFFPLLALVFWFFVVRTFLFRGGPWRRGWGRYYDGRFNDVPPMFDEWHRRAHEREGRPPSPPRS